MSDPRDVVQKMFEEANRFANFRDILVEIGIFGVRCHHAASIFVPNMVWCLKISWPRCKASIIMIGARNSRTELQAITAQ
jgi:uncharacterized OB-fold protein